MPPPLSVAHIASRDAENIRRTRAVTSGLYGESLAALASPDAEVIRALEAEPLRGPQAIRRWAADSFEAFTATRCSDIDVRVFLIRRRMLYSSV
jgi:hypothetical protein